MNVYTRPIKVLFEYTFLKIISQLFDASLRKLKYNIKVNYTFFNLLKKK